MAPELRQRKATTSTDATTPSSESIEYQTTDDARPITSIPISHRLPTSNLRTYLITFFFFLVLLPMHLCQLVFYPLNLIPGGLRELYWWGIACSSEGFAICLVHICRNTTIVLTVDDSLDLDEVYKFHKAHGKKMLNLEPRSVYMSNHQMYADWIYTWCLFHAASLSGYVRIFLKASLKHIPMAGPAMRLWHFIFLKNWTEDRKSVGDQVSTLGRRATKHKNKMAMLIFPEGTLVSALTRPKSQAYAEKIGVEDMKHCLLPRSTGLLFTLRTLKVKTPDLAFYDLTIGYPGIPPQGYAQSYYTLQTIFTASQGPEKVSIHLRKFNLADVPIGKVDPTLTPEQLDDALTEEERKEFDEWVRARWTEKDQLLDGFYKNGAFEAKQSTEWKIKSTWDDLFNVVAHYFALYGLIRIGFWTYRLYQMKGATATGAPGKSWWEIYTSIAFENLVKQAKNTQEDPLKQKLNTGF